MASQTRQARRHAQVRRPSIAWRTKSSGRCCAVGTSSRVWRTKSSGRRCGTSSGRRCGTKSSVGRRIRQRRRHNTGTSSRTGAPSIHRVADEEQWTTLRCGDEQAAGRRAVDAASATTSQTTQARCHTGTSFIHCRLETYNLIYSYNSFYSLLPRECGGQRADEEQQGTPQLEVCG